PKCLVEEFDDPCVTLHNRLLVLGHSSLTPAPVPTLAKNSAPRCERHLMPRMWICLKRFCGVQCAGASDGTANLRAVERFIDNLANGASAPPALCAATETTVDMARRAARRGSRRAAHFVVAQYVAGTDNHHTSYPGIRYRVHDAESK